MVGPQSTVGAAYGVITKTHHTCNGAKDHHWEDVEEIVRPCRLTVIVVAHALGQFGAQLGIGEIRLLENVHWNDQYVFA